MNANSLTRFAQACGAIRPLDLVLERPNGTIAKSCSIAQPFAVIGSDPYCDFSFPDSTLAPRHAALQVIAGKLFVMDISGRTNDMFIDGVYRNDGWLIESKSITISSHKLHLKAPIAPPLGNLPDSFQPLIPHAEMVSRYPKTSIEFRNGRTAQSRWDVNRVLTYVGRAKQCKINLTSEDVSLFHCYLLLTNDGIWAVDTFGRGGISVNGISQRFYRLSATDELQIARFVLGCAYPNGDQGEPVINLTPAPQSQVDFFQKHQDTNTQAPRFSSNQTPQPKPVNLPTSKVDLLKDNVEPATVFAEQEDVTSTPTQKIEMPKDLVISQANKGTGQGQEIAVTGQMFEQFQQSMLMMMKMFGQMHQQQMMGIQQEMARLSTLTEEISKMQGQIAQSINPAPVEHYNPLPDPDSVPGVSEETAGQHQLIFDKISEMESERRSIWKRLSNMFGAKETGVASNV